MLCALGQISVHQIKTFTLSSHEPDPIKQMFHAGVALLGKVPLLHHHPSLEAVSSRRCRGRDPSPQQLTQLCSSLHQHFCLVLLYKK